MMPVLDVICFAGCTGAHVCAVLFRKRRNAFDKSAVLVHTSAGVNNSKKRSRLLSDKYTLLVHMSARLLKKKRNRQCCVACRLCWCASLPGC